MRILLVEDNQDRIDKFHGELGFFGKECEHTLHVSKNAEGAIAYLKSYTYDLIFLDHDLGDREFVSSDDPNTGYQVAKAIAGTVNEDAYVVVHSMNPAGAKNIQAVLPKSVVAPFVILNIAACVETD